MMSIDRLKHSYAVANKMMEIGKKMGLSDKELEDLFLLGLVHDIGYQFDNNDSHAIVGANILENNNYKYSKEVLYHGKSESEYHSLYLDILNLADMMIDKSGNDVGTEKRLEDIKSRYGENSYVYSNCVKLVNKLKNRLV